MNGSRRRGPRPDPEGRDEGAGAFGRPTRDAHTGLTVAGRYRIGALIGAGGTGCVHEAVDVAAGRMVAAKFLSRRLLETPGTRIETLIERFRREASALAGLRHPHVVEILDLPADGEGMPCLIMELMVGDSLETLIAEGTLSLGAALAVLSVVLETLEHVHAAGVVHRDLKPSNVFRARTAEGETVKLLDFGIARLPGRTRITRGPLGTPAYSSPEQLAGRPVGPAADVYSIGAILRRMLVGSPLPFEPLGSRVPAPLVALVERAMARDPADRFPSAIAMRAALDAALEVLGPDLRARSLPL
jgi:serine/threonine-protein kinase